MKYFKKINVIFILLMILSVPIAIAKETSINDLETEISQLEADYKKKSEQLEEDKLELDEIQEELLSVSEEKVVTENQIVENENEINLMTEQIRVVEEEQIPTMEKRAAISLKFSQKNENENMILSIIYNGLHNNSDNILEIIQATAKISESLGNSLKDLFDLLNELETLKANLEVKSQELELQKQTLKEQEAYLAKLSNELSAQVSAMEANLSEQADIIAANEEQVRIFEEAGCKGDDVYGVDCANEKIESASGFSRPIKSGVVTNEYGGFATGNYNHSGIDIANNSGTTIYPSAPGTVLYAGETGDGGGLSVIMLHLVDGKNYITRYCHLNQISVSTGQSVSVGTALGGMGATGNVTGVHLHFEIEQGSNYDWYSLENPRNYVNFPNLGTWW